MANFEPKKLTKENINKGQRYQNGDGVDAEAINAPIESALWVQNLAVEQPNVIVDSKATTISVTIQNPDNQPYFQFTFPEFITERKLRDRSIELIDTKEVFAETFSFNAGTTVTYLYADPNDSDDYDLYLPPENGTLATREWTQWKLLGETEITQAMIDAAGANGINGVVIDLGAPIEKWYGETWVRFEVPKNNWSAPMPSMCQFGLTIEDALSKRDNANRCGLLLGQSSYYGQLVNNYNNTVNLFTNWYENLPRGTSYQLNGFSAYNYPYTAYASSNTSDKSVIGMRYLAYTTNSEPKVQFPVGTKLKLYGRF